MTEPVALNPFVSVVPRYGDEGPEEFVVRDYARNTYFSLPNFRSVHLFEMAADGVARAELVESAVDEFGLEPSLADDVVGRLESLGILLPADDDAFAVADAGVDWADDGWAEAFQFYRCIRDYPYHPMENPEDELDRIEERREQRGEPPAIYETYPKAPTVDLPDVDEDAPLASIRDAWRGRVDAEGFDRERLSRVLYYVFGETGRQPVPGLGEFVLKTSPSGGGRHPTEAYLQIFDVDGVDPGAYHYSVKRHELERLGDSATGRDPTAALGDRFPTAGSDPDVAIVASSRVERLMWKYQDPRAFRVPHHDVGHLFETLRVVARAEGLAATFEPPRDAATLADHFGLDRLTEPLVGCAALSAGSPTG